MLMEENAILVVQVLLITFTITTIVHQLAVIAEPAHQLLNTAIVVPHPLIVSLVLVNNINMLVNVILVVENTLLIQLIHMVVQQLEDIVELVIMPLAIVILVLHPVHAQNVRIIGIYMAQNAIVIALNIHPQDTSTMEPAQLVEFVSTVLPL